MSGSLGFVNKYLSSSSIIRPKSGVSGWLFFFFFHFSTYFNVKTCQTECSTNLCITSLGKIEICWQPQLKKTFHSHNHISSRLFFIYLFIFTASPVTSNHFPLRKIFYSKKKKRKQKNPKTFPGKPTTSTITAAKHLSCFHFYPNCCFLKVTWQ